MLKFRLSIAVIALAVCSCGNPDKPLEDEKISSLNELKNVSENFQESILESNNLREDRIKRGDTLAMPYKELMNYLPEGIDGYEKAGEPKGNQVDMPGLGSWSEVFQEYKNGDKSITVKIADYNSAHGTLAGLTALYKLGMRVENEEKIEGVTDMGWEKVYANETVYKKHPKTQLVLVVADRFLINMESQGDENKEILKEVARKMEIKGLADK